MLSSTYAYSLFQNVSFLLSHFYSLNEFYEAPQEAGRKKNNTWISTYTHLKHGILIVVFF